MSGGTTSPRILSSRARPPCPPSSSVHPCWQGRLSSSTRLTTRAHGTGRFDNNSTSTKLDAYWRGRVARLRGARASCYAKAAPQLRGLGSHRHDRRKEYLRLGLLLDQIFPGNRKQMVSITISPRGTSRANEFSRVDEFAFMHVILGQVQLSVGAVDSEEQSEARWQYLRRDERTSTRAAGRPEPVFPNLRALTRPGQSNPLANHLPRASTARQLQREKGAKRNPRTARRNRNGLGSNRACPAGRSLPKGSFELHQDRTHTSRGTLPTYVGLLRT